MAKITVRSGPLRHVAEIQSPTESRDDIGGVTLTWALWKKWRCSIEPITMRSIERLSGHSLQQEATHVVRGRYVKDLEARMRIVIRREPGDRTFEILAMADLVSETRMHELICREIIENA